jgi:hypothetical protein
MEGGEIAIQIKDWKKQCDAYWELKKRLTEGDDSEKAVKTTMNTMITEK